MYDFQSCLNFCCLFEKLCHRQRKLKRNGLEIEASNLLIIKIGLVPKLIPVSPQNVYQQKSVSPKSHAIACL